MGDRTILRQSQRAWRVEFVGEGATDQGTPQRVAPFVGMEHPIYVANTNRWSLQRIYCSDGARIAWRGSFIANSLSQ